MGKEEKIYCNNLEEKGKYLLKKQTDIYWNFTQIQGLW